MTTTTYSSPHIESISRKLQQDVNSILEDILEYFPEYKDGKHSKVDLDVDLVLRLHLLSKYTGYKHGHSTLRKNSTHNNPDIIRNHGMSAYVPYSQQPTSTHKKTFGIGHIWK